MDSFRPSVSPDSRAFVAAILGKPDPDDYAAFLTAILGENSGDAAHGQVSDQARTRGAI